jgi:hypothetical protein
MAFLFRLETADGEPGRSAEARATTDDARAPDGARGPSRGRQSRTVSGRRSRPLLRGAADFGSSAAAVPLSPRVASRSFLAMQKVVGSSPIIRFF